MNLGVTSTCPHCGAENELSAQFCASCGKAMAVSSSGPRVVEGGAMAGTSAGQRAQEKELQKKAKSASHALLAVAILATLAIAVVWMNVKDFWGQPEVGGIAKAMMLAQVVMAVGYYGLWIWSRSNPLPAAIVGLVIFMSLIVANLIMIGPQSLIHGIIVKFIIVAVLVKAIQAGMQHKQIQQRMAIPARR